MGYTPPQLEVRKITGGWSMFPPTTTTGDDIIIYPNGTDTTGYIQILGGNTGTILFQAGTTGYFRFLQSGVESIQLKSDATDTTFDSIATNRNLFLKTNGSGVIKFGTYSAGAATDSTGYITILDAAGNTRKLMVQA